MSENLNKSSLNVKGKYYVDFDTCLDHECCVEIAPNNIRMDMENYVAYFFKQPETLDEQKQCNEAVITCPVEAIRNDGDF